MPQQASDLAPEEVWEGEMKRLLYDEPHNTYVQFLGAAPLPNGLIVQVAHGVWGSHPNRQVAIGFRDKGIGAMHVFPRRFREEEIIEPGALEGGLALYFAEFYGVKIHQPIAQAYLSQVLMRHHLQGGISLSPRAMHRNKFGEFIEWDTGAANSGWHSVSGYRMPPSYEFGHRHIRLEWNRGTLIALQFDLPETFDTQTEAKRIQRRGKDIGLGSTSYRFDPFFRIRASGHFTDRSLHDWNRVLPLFLEKDWLFWGKPIQLQSLRWVFEREGNTECQMKITLDDFPEMEVKVTVLWEGGQFISIRYQWLPLMGVWRPKGY